MPTVRLLPDLLTSVISTAQYAGRDHSRIHVSDCIRYILSAMDPGTYGPEAQANRDQAEGSNRLEIGMAWERVLEMGVVQNAIEANALYIRPGPLELDDIVGTPDVLDMGGPVPVVEEWKATWMSCRGIADPAHPEAILDVPKFWKWVVQGKAYCKLVDTPCLRIRGLFVNGDYSKGKGGTPPTFLSWEFEFDQAELDENWAMLLGAARAVQRGRRS